MDKLDRRLGFVSGWVYGDLGAGFHGECRRGHEGRVMVAKADVPKENAGRVVVGLEGFRRELAHMEQSGKLHVTMFKVGHCRSCAAAMPKFFQLMSEFPDVNYVVVDGGDGAQLSSELKLTHYPTFRFFIRSGSGELGLLDEVVCGGFSCTDRVRRRLRTFTARDFRVNDYSF
mmetsp:Transcript_18201/g.37952  ORF Transcript_18201/g.37952 Transcript_18201/m.37952 type:complete len:173 (+) Transcript_18201:2177-2695(+)